MTSHSSGAQESLAQAAEKIECMGVPTVAQMVKDLALSLQQLRLLLRYEFNPWPSAMG